MLLLLRSVSLTGYTNGVDRAAWVYCIDTQMTSKLPGMSIAAINAAAANPILCTYCTTEFSPDLEEVLAKGWNEVRFGSKMAGMYCFADEFHCS